ncbi:MAG: LamG-like jellyroll fold domain-containing protein [Thermoguttaceae bacterium]
MERRELLSASPISRWSFDEGSGLLAADSVDGNPGTVVGATWTNGAIGSALSFDGIDDSVDIPDSANLHFGTGSFSLEMWINANTFVGIHYHDEHGAIRLIEKNAYPQTWWVVDILPDGRLEMEMGDSNSSVAGHMTAGTSTGTVSVGSWHHVAIAVDRGNFEVSYYIDGAPAGQHPLPDTFMGDLDVPGQPIKIGSPTFNPFNGRIDEVAIYDGVMTAEEAQQRYQLAQTPLAASDAYLMYGDTLSVEAAGVLANDVDPDGDLLTAHLVSGPDFDADFVLNPDGSFTYTPDAGFGGIDSFTYVATDGLADSELATVTIRQALYVTNTDDSGEGSFRWTIENANSHANDPSGIDAIAFAISGTGPHTIQPLTALPTVTDPVIIDGCSQEGYAGTPIIELDGSRTEGARGLYIWGSGNTVRGLAINGFDNQGIAIGGGNNNVIQGNFLGTDASGTVARANGPGIYVFPSSHSNLIGTDGDGVRDATEGNVISGNAFNGIRLSGSNDNIVAGNRIGVDVTGKQPLGNGGYGVAISGGASRNIVGTNSDGSRGDAAEGNVISANLLNGIRVEGSGTECNVIAGNFIGTDVTGTLGLPNTRNGVAILWGASHNRVGTDGNGIGDGAERNVISGNTVIGVYIGQAANYNNVAGNFIGVDATGRFPLPNGNLGVLIEGSNWNVIGTDGSNDLFNGAERNIISGNVQVGVSIAGYGSAPGSVAEHNRVAGNYIGTDVSGMNQVPGHTWAGVTIIELLGCPARSNIIGTNGDGLADEIERNVISGGSGTGVLVKGVGTVDNRVAGNYIGVAADGLTAMPNAWNGVVIRDGAVSNIIGTDGDGSRGDAAEGNVISANLLNGINVEGSGTDRNVIAGNFIGTDVTGTLGLPNKDGDGVQIAWSASHNRVGTDGNGTGDDAERNVISGNTGYGVYLAGSGNRLEGNLIGTGADGTQPLGNGGHGVGILGSSNQIVANTIAFNGLTGVNVGSGVSNSIQKNSIYSNAGLGIDLGGDGPTANDAIDADSGPNNLQNFPILTLVEPGPTTRVVGALDSAADTAFTIDFYSNDMLDPAGHPEGQRWLAAITVTTDSSGHADFDPVLSASTSFGRFVTATATDPNGNTSEFSHTRVRIDVKPGDSDPSLNLASNGKIAVVLFGTSQFDARSVNTSSVVFAGASAVKTSFEDVDHDGNLDAVLHFETQQTNLQALYVDLLLDDANADGVLDSTRQLAEVTLNGQTTDNLSFLGADQLNLFLAGKQLRTLLDQLYAEGLL